jgi:peptidoglycan/LPS O-acetylase OafA/YrhL
MPSTKDRLFYLDFIRVIALFIIILFHFNLQMQVSHPDLPLILPNGFGPIFLGEIGVYLFVMLSGASLAIAYKENLTLRAFYMRRAAALFPMYWVAYTIAAVLRFFMSGQLPPHLDTLGLTLIGMDGFLLYKIPNAYLIGEWFFGMILILYAAFPLLRLFVNKAPVIALLVAVGWLALIHPFYDQLFDMPENRNPLTLWPFMVFGMVLVRVFQEGVRKFMVIEVLLCAAALVAYNHLPHMLQCLLISTLLFSLLAFAASGITSKPLQAPLQFLSKYSFPAFLMHHLVSNFFVLKWPFTGSALERWALFLGIVVVAFVAGYVVHVVHVVTERVLKVGRVLVERLRVSRDP